MKYVRLILAMGIALAIALVMSVSAASAYPVTRHMYHFSPDDGFDAPILVTCNWKTNTADIYWHAVVEGQALDSCNMEGVYTGPYQAIQCQTSPGNWSYFWDGVGSNGAGAEKADFAPLYGCVMRKTSYR